LAVADPGRCFDDLFNFVYDPATLIVASGRVAGDQGANTPGVDGLTAAYVEETVGVTHPHRTRHPGAARPGPPPSHDQRRVGARMSRMGWEQVPVVAS
jgi:hypothetical protein